MWCGMQLSSLAWVQLTTCAQLRALIVNVPSIADDDLRVMGRHMRVLQVLGVVVGRAITVAGVQVAVSRGRFPALQKLLAAGRKDPRSRSAADDVRWCGSTDLAECIACARPLVEVELLGYFDADTLSRGCCAL